MILAVPKLPADVTRYTGEVILNLHGDISAHTSRCIRRTPQEVRVRSMHRSLAYSSSMSLSLKLVLRTQAVVARREGVE